MESPIPLNEILKRKSSESLQLSTIYRPLFFRTGNETEELELTKLLKEKPYIRVFDTIESQLKELIKTSKPNITFEDSELDILVNGHLGKISMQEYGVWVYYPWNEKLVHILDEKEFVDLRTNRNKYKITDEESAVLAAKKVGVIGLSVGQSVSLTLAMERGFGELRIADYDELEITNLNRLRSGIHNMGIKKTVMVAREIAEIDPFLKVTCYHDGITEDNLEKFLLEGGKLDVLIDECDGVDVKIGCRIAAKKYQIPVLMEASDRGTIDIERFDLEPERPILHGFVEHLDISNVKYAKNMEEKLPYILPIVGIETMSTRMKASAVEVGQTISTWPQLASAVTMGGGMTADVCRRILLDQLHQSGRYFIDIEELISDPKEEKQYEFEYEFEPLTREKMIETASKVKTQNPSRFVRDEKTIETLVKAAAIAPSAGNNQPWKWYFDGSRLFLFHDAERSASFGDFENMASYMALGTAIENLQLKAAELNLNITKSLFPLEDNKLLVAAFSFTEQPGAVTDELVNFLSIRYTNRNNGNGEKLDERVSEALKNAPATVTGSNLILIEDREQLKKLAGIIGQSEKLRLFIPQGHYDLFKKELRWTPELAEETKDGLDMRTLDLSLKDAIGFQVIKDPAAMRLVAEWNGGKALESMTSRLVSTSSAVGLVTMPSFTSINCLYGGQAAERVWLTAAKYQVAFQPVFAPVLHFARLNHGGGIDMPEKVQRSFNKLYEEFKNIFDLDASKAEPMFLFRLFKADEPEIKSLRLDFKDLYFSK